MSSITDTDIQAILAARYNEHCKKINAAGIERWKKFAEEFERFRQTKKFRAFLTSFGMNENVKILQRKVRQWLQTKATHHRSSEEEATDSQIKQEQNLEFVKSLSKDMDPFTMKNMWALGSFLQWTDDVSASSQEIWESLVSPTEELRDELTLNQTLLLKKVWLLANPNEEMVKYLGQCMLDTQFREFRDAALRSCRKPEMVTVTSSDEEVPLCIQCSEPAGVDTCIGDMAFCMSCFTLVSA